MHFSQQQISRMRVSMLCLAIAAIAACTPSHQSSNPNPATNLTSDAANAVPSAANQSKGTAKEQFTAIVGTQAEGWLPKVLAGKGLKKGLTPAATGKIIAGAEQVSKFGFSKVTVQNIPGLKQYEFYYAQDSSSKPTQLEAVKLHFDPALSQAYPDLVQVLSSKYGAVKPEDVNEQILVWVGPDFVTAQLTKQLTDFGGYELNVSCFTSKLHVLISETLAARGSIWKFE